MRQLYGIVHLFVASGFVGALFANPVKADGPLKAGEILIAVTTVDQVGNADCASGYIARIDPNPPFDVEGITTFGSRAVAIADEHTIYTMNAAGTYNNYTGQVYKVDVRSGQETLIYDFGSMMFSDIAVEGPGKIIVLVDSTVWRLDPTLGPSQTPELVVSDTQLQGIPNNGECGWGNSIDVAPNGDIFAASYWGVFRITPGAVTDVWSDLTYQGMGPGLDVDPSTGDLAFIAPFFTLFQADPTNPSFQPSIQLPVDPFLVDALAMERDGSAVIHGKRFDPVTQTATLMSSLYSSGQWVHWQDIEVVLPQCLDGRDNDGDGLVDLDDPHCTDSDDDREITGCTDGVDNDVRPGNPSDGIDSADSDCACVDNDGDGSVDDPVACPSGVVDNEGELPECADGVENGDSDLPPKTDRFDDECLNAWDDSETPECSDGIDNNQNTLTDLADFLVCFDSTHDCEDLPMNCPGHDGSCNNGWDDDGDGYVDLEDPECALNPATLSELPACDDGEDNDGDGLQDLADPECNNDATGNGELSDCNDLVDNDMDGFIDYPADPECSSATDDSEVAECADGLDNDRDGFFDYDSQGNGDPDCRHDEDPTEAPRQCSDGIDNDNDGLIDEDDPQCTDPEVNSEKCGAGGGQALLLLPFLWTAGRRRRRRGTRRARYSNKKSISSVLLGIITVATVTMLARPIFAQGGEGSSQFTGLSTAPEANLFAGSMGTSVPIVIPPGRKNATPDLKLAYSSGGGSGPFGYGWNVPLGTIERSTKHGRPRCIYTDPEFNHTRDFVLSLSGGQIEMVYEGPVSPSQLDIIRYTAKVDEGYVEAIADTSEQSPTFNTWTVFDRGGMIYRFSTDRLGNTFPDARVFNIDDVFLDGDGIVRDCEFTSIWALTQIEDPNGNTIDISYVKEHNTLYPDEVRYGANPTAGVAEHPFKVTFVREARAIPIESSSRGQRERMEQNIRRIEVHYKQAESGNPETGWLPVRAYDLTHIDPDGLGRLLLQTIDDDDTIAGDLLAPQTFTYSTASINHNTSVGYSHPIGNDIGFTDSDNGFSYTYRAAMDMNGDGLLDLVSAPLTGGGSWTWYPGTLGGFSSAGYTWGNSAGRQISRTDDDGGDPGNATLRWGVHATIDMTGDGIPDFVNASGTPWLVYPGQCDSTTNCWFSGTVINWTAPTQFLSYSTKSDSPFDPADPSWHTTNTLMDMSGDGRPDFIIGGEYSGQVFINTGTGFDPAWDADLAFEIMTHEEPDGTNLTVQDWFDFNGDGLPDRIESRDADKILVKLNTGRGITGVPDWIFIPVTGTNAIQATTGTGGGSGNLDVFADFADINGDGLPDRIRQSGTQWLVRLNQGGTWLGPEQTWPTALGHLRRTVLAVNIEGDGGVNTDAFTRTNLIDFDGDGFLDRLDATGAVHLGKPTSGPVVQPLVMTKADNGIGGVTDITYAEAAVFNNTGADGVGDHDLPFNPWIVKEIQKSDGLSPALVETMTYEGGLFDSDAREFRGFRTVTRTDSDGNYAQVTFGQGEFDRGKVLVSEQYTQSGQLLSRDTSTWATRIPVPFYGRTQVYLAERKSEEFDVSSSGFDRCMLNRSEPPDDYGRTLTTCSLSCTAQGAPGSCATNEIGQVDTVMSWAEPLAGFHMRERPLTVETHYVNASGASELLARKEFYYDGEGPFWGVWGLLHSNPAGQVSLGNVKRVVTKVTEGPDVWATVWSQYDALGNITSVTDAEGTVGGDPNRTATSSYSASPFSLYPSSETNALGHSVTTKTDLRYGKPYETTDPNGATEELGYDGLGRVLCEAKPGQALPRAAGDLSGCDVTAPMTYAARYSYYRGNASASPFEDKLSYVERHVLEPAANGHLTSRQYADGLGRKRLATAQTIIGDSNAYKTIVTGHVDYGNGGRVADQFVPYVLTGAIAQDPGVSSTTFDYALNGTGPADPLGRVHKVMPPDGNDTTAFYEGRRTCVVTGGGTHSNKACRIEDDFGREIRKETYEGSNQTPTTYFEMAYDGMGRVLKETVSELVSNPSASTLVTHAYDLLGRETSVGDANSGPLPWTFQYDHNGNVVYRDDPKTGQHVEWIYDALGRVTHTCTFDNDAFQGVTTDCGSGTQEALYVYDLVSSGSKGVGRLGMVFDPAGVEAFVYDERGRIGEQTRSIGGTASMVPSDSISAVTSFEYDDADRVRHIVYPDGERVRNTYSPAGQLRMVHTDSGSAWYVNNIEYDFLGRVQRLVHGTDVEDIREYYDSSEGFRLKKLKAIDGGTSHLDLEYAYNDLGKVASIVDQRNPTGDLSNTVLYGYDALGRLTNAVGVAQVDTFAYDSTGNLTEKDGHTLPYGSAGLDCSGQPLAGPHQLANYGGTCFSYNENGERTEKGSEAYAYDVLGRVTHVLTAGGDNVDYRYDYAGRRVAKRVNSGEWTRYFSAFAESEVDAQSNGQLIKYYFAGDTRVAMNKVQTQDFVDATANPAPLQIPPWCIALFGLGVLALLLNPGHEHSRLGVAIGPARALGTAGLVLMLSSPALLLTGCPVPSGGAEHYHLDHLGSTQAVTDGNGQLIHQVRYAPYGEIRGRFDAAGVAANEAYTHEFTGYETESESGLQYAGARYFDPEVGQFLSHDPKQQYASPYAYGPGDPVNGTDPDGQIFETIVTILYIAGIIATGYDAYRATGSISRGFAAAYIAVFKGGFIGGLGQVIGPVIGNAVGAVLGNTYGQVARLSYDLARGGYQAYQQVRAAGAGDVAAALTLFGTAINLGAGVTRVVDDFNNPSLEDLMLQLDRGEAGQPTNRRPDENQKSSTPDSEEVLEIVAKSAQQRPTATSGFLGAIDDRPSHPDFLEGAAAARAKAALEAGGWPVGVEWSAGGGNRYGSTVFGVGAVLRFESFGVGANAWIRPSTGRLDPGASGLGLSVSKPLGAKVPKTKSQNFGCARGCVRR